MRGIHHVLAGCNLLPERQFHCSVRPAASGCCGICYRASGSKGHRLTPPLPLLYSGSLGPLQGCAGLLWMDPDTQYISVKH